MEKATQSFRRYVHSTYNLQKLSQYISIDQLDYSISKSPDKFSIFDILCKIQNTMIAANEKHKILLKYIRRGFLIATQLLSKEQFDLSKTIKIINIIQKISNVWKQILIRFRNISQDSVVQFFDYQLKQELFFYLISIANNLVSNQIFPHRNFSQSKKTVNLILPLTFKQTIKQKCARLNKNILKIIYQHQNQTKDKIKLIFQSLKMVYIQFSFVSCKSDIKETFELFIKISEQLIRSLQKFQNYSSKLLIKQFKKMLSNVCIIYQSHYVIYNNIPGQFEYFQKLVAYINNYPYKDKKTKKQEKIVLILAYKILKTWKSKERNKKQINLFESQIIQNKQKPAQGKQQQISYLRYDNLQNKIRLLKTRKVKSYSLGKLENTILKTPINPIKIKNQVQNTIKLQFQKLNYLNVISNKDKNSLKHLTIRRNSLGLKFQTTKSISQKYKLHQHDTEEEINIKNYIPNLSNLKNKHVKDTIFSKKQSLKL